MKEILELIEYLAKRAGELAFANKELREENMRLLREIEGMRPFVRAYEASTNVVKK